MSAPTPQRRWEDGAVSIAALIVMFGLAAAWLHEHMQRRSAWDRLAALERRLLIRLDAPPDNAQFDARANVAVDGEVFLPPEFGSGESLVLRARLYHTQEGALQTVNESRAELAPPKNGVASFQANVRQPRGGVVLAPGKYLLRVDCLDQFGVLLGSQAVFIEFVR
jgi:hypothetical protein